jgi:ribosomal protein S18 acetylase RimI-like enzyme
MTLTMRAMQAADLDFAASLTAAEGWGSETKTELEGFFAFDPGGCLLAEQDGERVGMCVATSYGESAFVGELIVTPSARRKGVGRSLLESAINHVRSRGAASILLDGVAEAVPLYERVGFRKVCRSMRFDGRLSAPSSHAQPMRQHDLDAVLAMDLAAFGADRSFFLRRRLKLYPQLCFVLLESGPLSGFIMARPTGEDLQVGPWVVRRGAARGEELLAALTANGARTLHIGVLATNLESQALLRSLGLRERADPPWRMVLGPSARLGTSDRMYATGSAAKG